ncbi:MAG TPA: hypothetical protein VFL82_08250, partial [Thermomicrobiales bacterium]|nr:hypothetical protein [Thermomicrobiales bacterium]
MLAIPTLESRRAVQTVTTSDLPAITTSRMVSWLAVLIAVLAFVAAVAGLFWSRGNAPFIVTSVHGEEVELYKHGLYRHDTLFVGALNRGTDVAVLLVAIPLLLVATIWYRR